MADVTIKKGLEGVVVDSTKVSKVMPETNSLTYRGYPVQELCEHCSFEEVAYLLWYGELPTRSEIDSFMKVERSRRQVSKEVLSALSNLPKTCHPMDAIRTGVSICGAEDSRIWESSREVNLDKAMGLLARIPTMVAAQYRFSKGLDPIAPDSSLGFAANFFHMCFGKVPTPETIKAFDVSLILYAEHGFNASTFAARVIASTLSDLYSAVTGGIGALKGPLHGGANEQVMHVLHEIGEVDRAENWVVEALEKKKKIMGFGHRVYKQGDSRVPTMKKYLKSMADSTGQHKWVQIADIVERVVIEKKNIHPNVDFPTGPAYFMMGFEIEMFTPIFVMSRITGWSAHIIEQLSDNRIIRPLSQYLGPEQRKVVPVATRGQ